MLRVTFSLPPVRSCALSFRLALTYLPFRPLVFSFPKVYNLSKILTEETLDIWGFIIIGVSLLAWIITRKRYNKSASFFLLTRGVGIGIVAGAVWSYILIDTLF